MAENKSNIIVKIIAIVFSLQAISITIPIPLMMMTSPLGSLPLTITLVILVISLLFLFGVILYGLWRQQEKLLPASVYLNAFFVYFILSPLIRKKHISSLHNSNINIIDLTIGFIDIAIMTYLLIHFRKTIFKRKQKIIGPEVGVK